MRTVVPSPGRLAILHTPPTHRAGDMLYPRDPFMVQRHGSQSYCFGRPVMATMPSQRFSSCFTKAAKSAAVMAPVSEP